MDTNKIKTLLELPVETCGYVDDEMTLIIDGVPKIEDSRNICVNNTNYHPIIWHTHPFDMKSYPSMEDIRKILKLKSGYNPKVSLIFTKWGIWKLWAGKKGLVSNNIERAIIKSYSGLYHITEKGRGNINIPFVQSYIEELEYILQEYRFSIRLTTWNKLGNRGIYNI